MSVLARDMTAGTVPPALHKPQMHLVYRSHQKTETPQDNVVCACATQKKKISHRQLRPLRGSSSSPFGALSQRGLDPIKLAYNPSRPNGRL